MSEPSKKLAGFCSAPWTDLIAYSDGNLRVCDRNVASFGNWQQNGLANTWNSEALQKFRKDVAAGTYPDSDCASCHNNGTQRTPISSLGCAYPIHYNSILKHLGPEAAKPFETQGKLFELKTINPEADEHIQFTLRKLAELERGVSGKEICKELADAFVKIRVIMECLEDYLKGAPQARRVAPFRQSQLQAKCNARCVMCAGLYTGEIINGPSMPEEWVDENFARIEDVVDFWCNGSEFFLYKDWKKIALKLYNEGGTKFRISTNGILLTEQNVRFMIDNGILEHMTLSLDGASKEVLESIRRNVKFDDNMKRIQFLVDYAREKNHSFTLIFAFVLMKRNYHELPEFIRMIKRFKGEKKDITMVALIQPLENFDLEGYRSWVHNEHHSLIDQAELDRILHEVHDLGKENDVLVSFYNAKLDEHFRSGAKLPKYFARKLDEKIFLEKKEDFQKQLAAFWASQKEKMFDLVGLGSLENSDAFAYANGEIEKYKTPLTNRFSLVAPHIHFKRMIFQFQDSLDDKMKRIAEEFWAICMGDNVSKEIYNEFSSVKEMFDGLVSQQLKPVQQELYLRGLNLIFRSADKLEKFVANNFQSANIEGNDLYFQKEFTLCMGEPLLYQSRRNGGGPLLASFIAARWRSYILLENGEIISQSQARGPLLMAFGPGGSYLDFFKTAELHPSASKLRNRRLVFSLVVGSYEVKNAIFGKESSWLFRTPANLLQWCLRAIGIKIALPEA